MVTTKKLEKAVQRLKDACHNFQQDAGNGSDYQRMCKDLIFEISLATTRVNEFVAQEED